MQLFIVHNSAGRKRTHALFKNSRAGGSRCCGLALLWAYDPSSRLLLKELFLIKIMRYVVIINKIIYLLMSITVGLALYGEVFLILFLSFGFVATAYQGVINCLPKHSKQLWQIVPKISLESDYFTKPCTLQNE